MGASVSEAEFEGVIAQAEERLGLKGQPRAVVFHERNGRRHAHVVWSRIDASSMNAINLPHFKRKLMGLSREMFLEHGWEMPEGYRDADKRDLHRYSREEAGQAKRAERDTVALKRMFSECWAGSDTGEAFAAALKDNGFILARGDQRGYVAVDADGKVWSLSRWCRVKTRDLRDRLRTLVDLADVEQARQLVKDLREPQRIQPDPQREARLKELVAEQRAERAALLEAQKQRMAEELRARPKGLRKAFLWVTGQHAAFISRCEEEARAAKSRDAAQRQAMIDRHIAARRAFEWEIGLSRLHHAAARPDARQSLVERDRKNGPSKADVLANPECVLETISHHKADFSRADVMRALADHMDDPAKLSKATALALKSDRLVSLPGNGVPRYTTRDYQAAETRLPNSSAGLVTSKGSAVSNDKIAAAMAKQNKTIKQAFGGRLSEEQFDANRHALGKEQFAQVVGLAGAGKSTMLATAADAWQRQGIKVHGAALAGKAEEGLQDSSGIKSRTLAALELSWENGHTPIERGDVLVIDEAGMLGTRQLSRVTAKCQEIGAKLVLVGDPDQLQPIEAGTPFRDLVDIHSAAKLTEIHRQREDWQKQASRNLAEGNTDRAMRTYRDKNSIKQSGKISEAMEALVEQYAMDSMADDPVATRLAFAHRRKDVHALNQGIRKALRGEDAEQDMLLSTATGKRAFAPGDRIVFGRNDKELGVKNGMLGTVEAASDGKVRVSLDGDTERRVSFDPRAYQHFDHGYAVTIHKSQGATVDAAYVLASRSMDKHLAYVAMTRHRDKLQIYSARQDEPRWLRHLDRDRAQARPRAGPSRGPSIG
ncbi:MAG: AAA family ATPase [Pseudomonadota bacterium]